VERNADVPYLQQRGATVGASLRSREFWGDDASEAAVVAPVHQHGTNVAVAVGDLLQGVRPPRWRSRRFVDCLDGLYEAVTGRRVRRNRQVTAIWLTLGPRFHGSTVAILTVHAGPRM